ncbi:MAG: hypothetical protein ACC662_10675, partial [Planctomycetota bacterium]
DPLVLKDQIPATPPVVLETTPLNSTPAVTVEQGNEIMVRFSENIDPCTIDGSTVLFEVFEVGDPTVFEPAPNGNGSGFVPVENQDPSPFAWGSTTAKTISPPQKIPAEIRLVQDFQDTRLLVTPTFGEFPDNALLVLQLSFAIRDFGGDPLTPTTLSFTTANRTAQDGTRRIAFDGTTPIDLGLTTADVNTARAPGRAQGFLLFAGDGDNGGDVSDPSYPASITPPDCTTRPNTGKTEFDPPAGNTILDTGSTRSTCVNTTDGSTAVVWEFETFRIQSGRTVSIVGVNPAIILVRGGVRIDAGGQLLVRGANGRKGDANSSSTPSGRTGGKAVAGGGNGEDSVRGDDHGEDGFAGYGSPGYPTQGGTGAGDGGVSIANDRSTSSNNAVSAGGGGGGHATAGGDGNAFPPTSNGSFAATDVGGTGGAAYPSGGQPERMLEPSAGSGGGASGDGPYNAGGSFSATGGSGGAGGGFVDLTTQGDIRIAGTIDASGGAGGGGAANWGSTGGAGGGAGGGIRLLTPQDIDVGGGTLTAVGGSGGAAGIALSGSGNQNTGGAGGVGRIVLEDGDSVITGLNLGTVVPGEGADGFFRSTFDATRFQGGGLQPVVVSDPLLVGPVAPPV